MLSAFRGRVPLSVFTRATRSRILPAYLQQHNRLAWLPLINGFHSTPDAPKRDAPPPRVRYSRIPPQSQPEYYEEDRNRQYYDDRQQMPRIDQRIYYAIRPYRTVMVICSAGALIFYVANLETVPVSGRTRFNVFSAASMEEQGEEMYRQILQDEGSKGTILPEYHPKVKQVRRVLNRLIEKGGLGTGTEGNESGWVVTVIENPRMVNAFVLPGGKVFVYTGILPICRGDEGLAAVLGHEISHNIAQHSAENASRTGFIIQPLVAIFRLLDVTGYTFGLGAALSSVLLNLTVGLPGSRQQESEADYIGLMLMAQSCYDPKAAEAFWTRMEEAAKENPPQWLSTHPSNSTRIQQIHKWIPKAEEKRQESDCAITTGYVNDFQRTLADTYWGKS